MPPKKGQDVPSQPSQPPSVTQPPFYSGQEADYDAWKRRFVAFLGIQGLRPVTQMTAAAAQAILNPPQGAQAPAGGPTAEHIMRVRDLLVLSLDERTSELVASHLTSQQQDFNGAAAWAHTIQLLEGDNYAKLERLKMEFSMIRVATDAEVEGLLLRVTQLATQINQLSGAAQQLAARDKARALLMGLPKAHGSWCDDQLKALRQVPDNGVAAHYLDLETRVRLRIASAAERQRRAELSAQIPRPAEKREATSEVFFSRDKRPGQKGRKEQRQVAQQQSGRDCQRSDQQGRMNAPDRSGKRRTCYRCQSEKHFIRNCPEPPKPDEQVRTAISDSEDADLDFVVLDNVVDGERPRRRAGCTYEWILDSGATRHICASRAAFSTMGKVSRSVRVADGKEIKAVGAGKVEMLFTGVDGRGVRIELDDVLYVPEVERDIISLPSLCRAGHEVRMAEGQMDVLLASGELLRAVERDRLFILDAVPLEIVVAAVTESPDWHRRAGHVGNAALIKACECVDGIPRGELTNSCECESCTIAKMRRSPGKARTRETTRRLELVHSDIHGPMRTPTFRDGHVYLICFVDDFTGYVAVYTLKAKSQALAALKHYIASICGPVGQKIGTLRTDNGGEYISAEFESFLLESGIHHELTVPYTPEQNGVAERYWQTLLGSMRAMIADADCDKMWWGYAAKTACYLRNRIPNKRSGEVTPYEKMFDRRPDLSHLRTWGCRALVRVPIGAGKLEPRAVAGMLVGYSDSAKAYLVWLPLENEVIVARDVKFYEDQYLPKMDNQATRLAELTAAEPGPGSPVGPSPPVHGPAYLQQPPIPSVPAGSTTVAAPTVSASGRPVRNRVANSRIYSKEYANMAVESGVEGEFGDEPATFQEALESPDSAQWTAAMQEEIDNLTKNGTWELVKLPPDARAISCKWVFRIKRDAENRPVRYKSRLVARGFLQRPEQDYRETFSPVIRLESLRATLALAAARGWPIYQADVTAAYLNGDIDVELFMEQPPGFVKTGAEGEKLVCRLRKSLYGLKQAGRIWNETLVRRLQDYGMVQSTKDPCLFTRFRDGETVILTAYVDDMIITGSTQVEIDRLIKWLADAFKLSDVKKVSWVLGIRVTCEENGDITLDQQGYIEALLSRFKMEESAPALTPAETCEIEGESPPFEHPDLYRSLVGALLYLSNVTRPDLAYAVNQAAKYVAAPTRAHMRRAQRVLRYAKKTKGFAIRYKCGGSLKLTAFSDADWARDPVTRRSVSGILFCLAGGPISWASKPQGIVALSTM